MVERFEGIWEYLKTLSIMTIGLVLLSFYIWMMGIEAYYSESAFIFAIDIIILNILVAILIFMCYLCLRDSHKIIIIPKEAKK